MARLYTIIATILLAVNVHAQELEYALELGAMGGPGFYMGDANTNGFYKNVTMAGGLMGRYNINPRMALKFDLGFGSVKGDASKGKNKFPEKTGQKWDFNNSLVDVGCQYELNFWGYGTGTGFKGSKRLSPYIQMGLGFTYDKLDCIEDPYKVKSGFLKNKDSYSWTMVYISYDLCPKYRKCNND